MYKYRLAILALVLSCLKTATALAQPYVPAQTYFGRSNYTEYVAGDMQLIFSAPHGGALTPAEIPDRTNGVYPSPYYDPDFTTVTDENTEQVALAVQSVFAGYFGHSPHIIICQLKRTKIDCNRSQDEGCNGTNAFAIQAWNEFQNFIVASSNYAVAQNGRGFYIDLHGQGHAIQRLELGYLLTAEQLTNTDTVLNQPTYAAQSSIRSLAAIVSASQGISFAQLLRGSNSFGDLMARRGFPSVPSPTMPNPGNGTNPIVYPGDQNPYFDGGYNTAVYSSQNNTGPIDGLQIEADYTGVRDTAQNITNYATALAQVLDYIFTNYYGRDLRLCAPSIWNGSSGAWATAHNWSVALPVSGNFLLFAGTGGSVTNNLSALTTGIGRVYSLNFATNTSGSYKLTGNAVSLVAGVTNLSTLTQIISNALTLLSNQTFSANSGPLVVGGSVTNGGSTLILAAGTNITMSGVISGSGGLNKSGAGTLVLSGANTYSGPTTNLSGTLLVSNSIGNNTATGSGPVIINPGAILSGSGTIGGPVTVLGSVVPGNPIGQLKVTNGLDLSNGTYTWLLGSNSASASFSQILVAAGNIALGNNSTLAIVFTNTATTPDTNNPFWQSAHSWVVITNQGTATVTGQTPFASIVNGSFAAGRFSTSVDAQNDVLLNYIPIQQPVISASLPGAGTTNVTINWSAVAGLNYQVQYSSNLTQNIWLPLGDVLATNTSATWTDSTNVQSQRFYRVVIQ